MNNRVESLIISMKDTNLYYNSLFFIVLYRITSSEKENSTKTNFWQRFCPKRLTEQSTKAMNHRNLVTEIGSLLDELTLLFTFQFRYATLFDIFYLMIATVVSCTLGVAFPLNLVVFGSAIDSFTDRSSSLCSLNFTSLSREYCPIGITLTSINFYTSMS
jgi:hypothetical protein